MLTADQKVVARAPANWDAVCEPVRPFLAQVSEQLRDEVAAFDPRISAFVQYALASQGKQLRPLLVALGGRVAGRLNSDHVMAAVIIELVHLATLVHDDVIDAADQRRNRPTLAASWGNEISVLAGDCLFAQALKRAAEFPTPEVCRMVAEATKTVCTGEILQTLRRGDFQVAREEYLRELRMKTAELFALACRLGLRLGGGEGDLREYGLNLGTAYQLYDDCLDVFGSEPSAGKSLGTDLATGKATLPLMLALEQATAGRRDELRGLLADWRPELGEELRAMLATEDCRTACRTEVDGFLEGARGALVALPANEGRAGLAALVDCLEEQMDGLGAG